MRRRSGIVLTQGEQIALIQRVRSEITYYVFPGGGVEPGESVEDAAVREAYEELGVQVQLGPLLAQVQIPEAQQFYFVATITGGEFGTGQGPEFLSPAYAMRGSYTPVWIERNRLAALDVRPRGLARTLAAEAVESLLQSGRLPLRFIET